MPSDQYSSLCENFPTLLTSQTPRLKRATMVRWGGEQIFGKIWGRARRYIQRNITDCGGFCVGSG